jgi:hypothetical protein
LRPAAFLNHVKETIVNKLNALLLATLFGFGASLAYADDAPTKAKSARTTTAAPATTAPAEPVKIATGKNAPVFEAGDWQKGRRAQGLHEDLPVKKGVASDRATRRRRHPAPL